MQIIIVNNSSIATTAEVKKMVAACQTQVSKHFCPAWGLANIKLRVSSTMPDSSTLSYDTGVIGIYDTPDDDALGYHTKEADRIFGKVFVQPLLDEKGVILLDPQNDQTPTVASTLSHEVLELIADPSVNAWVDGPPSGSGSEYSYEVCDPVENDQYVVGGVAISNFVLPAWFDVQTHNGEQYDWRGKLRKPFTMTAGGYMVVRSKPGAEKQIFARKKLTARQRAKASHGLGRSARRVSK